MDHSKSEKPKSWKNLKKDCFIRGNKNIGLHSSTGFFSYPVNYFLFTLVGMLDTHVLGKDIYDMCLCLPSFWIPRVPPWSSLGHFNNIILLEDFTTFLSCPQIVPFSSLSPCEGAINKQLDSVMSLGWRRQAVVGLAKVQQASWFPHQNYPPSGKR